VPVLLIDCVSVAVAFIPGAFSNSSFSTVDDILIVMILEGLPICVTLSLTVM
jgi:hypothetical protein